MSEFENNTSEATEGQTDGVGQDDGNVEGEESFSFESDSKPRNTTALLFLGLLMIGGGTLYVMRMKGGPQAAAASVETTAAVETINQFLTEGDKNILAMREMLKNTEKIVQQFVSAPTVPDIDLMTNPFKLRKGDGQKDAAAESEAARQKRLAAEKDAEKKEIVKAVGDLRVQSILNGRTPTCMINSKMYVEGQEVGGFTLEKIKPESVIVKQKEYKFELRINKGMN